ncbi:(2Fe-2S)-binding protein [Salinisphaera orenii MK-B5]|uniref:(2Fe-2S)-binding protein n=2 Tax=Salinisphaera orenii TaxID=856731 RepID=A0A423PKS7_9GAMM|nr:MULTISPECIES: (2Fe-2S)-binding protein [Salinisphaera]ROO26207.1 (2Fe-2S)-binding protein [Salinisphaera orenii MK-B5]ROO34935.1 (2Fe-2S)-binding protein [Salinisphaera halophila YIM 95161]
MKITVNGSSHEIDAPDDMPLLWAIRDRLKLTGTKYGCGVAQCGACTVMVDGQPKRSCVTPLKFAAGHDITTIEGMDGAEFEAIQTAWRAIDVPQCGFCQSGQVMTATALLKEKPAPSDTDIDNALAGNICRCATYVRIRQAVRDAADTLEA